VFFVLSPNCLFSLHKIALRDLRGATTILWELTDENGKAIWKINLIYQNQKRELKIDALNKNII
ncbi:PepSY domain-containing protein, partial [Lactobacillus helveticus]|uniref:PepSY domain-containing protein n=2 Tax=Lactobacillus TaxID=1578 RepID=UPI001C267801